MSEEKYQFHIENVQGLVIGENNIPYFNFPGHEPFGRASVQSPSLPIYHIPYRRNSLFTGRENLLQELRENLISTKSVTLTQPQAISGLGGIGKTQIALEYAYLYQNKYQVILWINSASEEEILSDLIKIADRLCLHIKDEDDHIVVANTIRNWLENTTNWLLIFDNVENLLAINTLLPTKNIGHIIITTRIQATGALAQSIIVEKMNEDEAVLFLLRRAKVILNEALIDSVTPINVAKAKEIVYLLDSLPLALDHAGAYIEETACNLAGYLDRYQHQKLRLLGRSGNFSSYHPEPVTTTWSLSFEKIKQTNPLAAELLTFCSFLAPDAIPEELIIIGAMYLASIFPYLAGDLFDLDEAISTLRSYSLINRNGDLKIISIHRLVQAVHKENLDQSTQKQWTKNVTKAINHFFPSVYIDTWDKCQKYLPHARYCLTQIGQFKLSSPEVANLSRKVGRYFYDQSLFPEAEASYTQALQIINELFGPETTFSMEICRGLAKVYDQQENFEKAKGLLINALGIAQKKLNFDHLKKALILSDLAAVYEKQGEYEKAEEMFEKFREVLNSGRKYRNIEVAHAVIKLADFHWHRGQFYQAETLYKNILTIVKQVYGVDHFQTALILEHMADFYREQGKYDVAEPLYQRTLAILEQTFKSSDPRFAHVINNLALLYYQRGQYDLAEPLFKESYTLTQKIYGQSNTRSATILGNLALLYRDRGEYDLAIPLFQHVYELYSAVFGVISPECGNTLNDIGGTYVKQDMPDTAVTFFMSALEILKKALGDRHPDVANVLGNLALVHFQKQQYVQAENLFLVTLDIRRDAFGKHSHVVAESMQSLAQIYDKQGNYEKAIPLYKNAMAIYERIFGEEHVAMVPPLNNLATIYITQKKYDLAENTLHRAIAIERRTNYPELVVSLSNLALLYGMQKKYKQAEIINLEVINLLEETPNRKPSINLLHYEELSEIYCITEQYGKSEFYLRKALVLRRQHFESDQEIIATTLSNLGFVCEEQGKYVQAKHFYNNALQIFKSSYSSAYLLKLAMYRYNTITEKINNSLVKSSKGKNTLDSDKYTHRNKANYTSKGRKKKQKKQK